MRERVVRQAFNMAEITKFPVEIEHAYVEEDCTFERYSEHTRSLVHDAVKEAVKDATQHAAQLIAR